MLLKLLKVSQAKLGRNMDKIISQFRRVYSDNGSGDRDFTLDELRLRAAEGRVIKATQALKTSSDKLNDVALMVMAQDQPKH